jgi:hypothetical protein
MSRNVKFGMYMNNEYTYKLRSNIDFNFSLTKYFDGVKILGYIWQINVTKLRHTYK